MTTKLTDRDAWKHIAVHENGKRDLSLTIVDLFCSQLSEEVKRWLRLEVEENERRIKEAEDHVVREKA
jgi:hypothetical protein